MGCCGATGRTSNLSQGAIENIHTVTLKQQDITGHHAVMYSGLNNIQLHKYTQLFTKSHNYRGVQLAKNDIGSVFGLVLQKTAVFGSVSVLQN